MRQRLGLAAALLRRPRLLLLDEPTTGSTPAGMRDMRRLVATLAERGADGAAVDPPDGGGRAAVQRAGRHRPRADPLRGHHRRPARRPPGRRLPAHGHRRRAAPSPPAATCPASASRRTAASGQLLLRRRARGRRPADRAPRRGGVGIYAMLPDAPTLEELFFGLTEGAGVDRLRTYGWELRKLVAQRRTLAGLLVAVLIPAAFAIGLGVNPATRPGQGRDRRSRRLHRPGLQHLRAGAAADRPLLLLPRAAARCSARSSPATSWPPRTATRRSRPC